jgi:4-hydroxybenzoate polyprenyltransferase
MNTEISISPGNFISAYWLTMRPYLLYVSGITGLGGISFAESIAVHHVIILFSAFFFSYGFGQALTDCFQTDTDARSSPYRPLVRRILWKRDVFIVSLTGLFLCGIILGYFNYLNLIIAGFCIVGLATYTFFKRRWWGGPWYNAWIVALLFMMGYLSGGGTAFTPQLYMAMLAVVFGYMNFVLAGYFKDVSADASTDYNTLPVVIGRKKSAVVSSILSILFLASAAVSILIVYMDNPNHQTLIASLMFLGAAVGFTVYSQWQLHKNTEDRTAYRAIVPCVHSYILALIAITATNKPSWIVSMIVFYLLFAYFMSTRVEKTQI